MKSKAIEQLEQRLAEGHQHALAEFWDYIEKEGAPLVEPIEGDEEQRLVTFLWRPEEEIQNVLVFGPAVGWDLEENLLTHVPGTDLWYKSVVLPHGMRGLYSFFENSDAEPSNWRTRVHNCMPDRFNPQSFLFPADEECGDPETIRSILDLDAPPQLWHEPREGVAYGDVEHHRFRSEMLGDERSVWISTPAGYQPDAEPYGILLAFDGWCYTQLFSTPVMLDHLHAEGKIPPLVGVYVNSPDDHEARVEQLGCNEKFLASVVEEVLPWVREHWNVTVDPSQVVVAGSSIGGLSSMFFGFKRPDVFGNVLAQSGSFWWTVEHPGWLADQVEQGDTAPAKVYMDMGTRDGERMLAQYDRMRDVLQAKGVPVSSQEFIGGHDYLQWRGTIADGLIALLGK